jgi:predicted secreted protein
MNPLTMFAIYLTLWWTTLFVVLPLGNRTYHEEGINVTDGGDPGAPVNPNLKKKFITTTWVSAIVWIVLMAALHFHWIPMPSLAHWQ